MLNFIQPYFIFRVLTIPLSLVVHEYSHARVADLLGDKTPRLTGRLTLNPIAHLDLLGTLMMLFGPIGWAKPVPISGSNFKHPRLGLMLTAFAGPLSNFVLACFCFIVIRMWPETAHHSALVNFFYQVFSWGAFNNIVLFIFNLIPLPPLDGSRIVSNLLPYRQEMVYRKLDVYGPFLLLLIFVIPFMRSDVMYPLFRFSANLVASWFGLGVV